MTMVEGVFVDGVQTEPVFGRTATVERMAGRDKENRTALNGKHKCG